MDVLKFINCVRRQDCIYNKNCVDYRQRDVVFDAWRNIAKEMNISVIECKEKWHNLRSNYMRERKKVLGFGIKKWHLLDTMSFLEPYQCARKGQRNRSRRQSAPNARDEIVELGKYESSTPQNVTSTDHFSFEDPNDVHSREDDTHQIAAFAKFATSELEQSIEGEENDMYERENLDKNSGQADVQCNIATAPAIRSPNKFKNHRMKLRKHNKWDGIDYEFLKQVRKLTRHLNDPTEDSDRMFLLSLLPVMKQLTPKDNLNFRVQVQQILEHKLNN